MQPNWKEVKVSLCTEDMIPHIGRPQNSTKSYQNYKFNEIAGCKINIQNPLHIYKIIINSQKET